MRTSHSSLAHRLVQVQDYLCTVKDYKPLLGRSEFVRRHLAYNSHTDPLDFLSDPSVDVRHSAALRTLTLAQQQGFVRDPSPVVRAYLAHKRTDISIWRILARDPEVWVRQFVASRRDIPPEIQEILLLDCPEVQRVLKRNPRVMLWVVDFLKDVV